ncbi:CGNR zinc finger domain-containing protein [Saccharothrix violaceirubra]|uniref:Putative RNA-binding Zn ribbon-like protein n=1 Tax=Saccharothrix violaceirubra TaxID=413306 RepID=A0A7W7TAE6_9PSEU|nr:ABATE domain-containing protein [Saccharothrix violaceirubra]MBB4969416.1 putative RNA-binding Zn ribbon-like protein [Saccharothrix violaceirubra]
MTRPGLDLVATVRSRLGGVPCDGVTTPDTLAAWLSAQGHTVAERPDEAHVREFRALREAAYRLLGAAVDGTTPARVDVDLVNRCARQPAPAVVLSPDLAAVRERPTVAQVLGVLARDVVDLLTGPDRDRLHQCEAEVCGSYFVDTSRAGRRRWCSSATCGNRVRVAAHRSRA